MLWDEKGYCRHDITPIHLGLMVQPDSGNLRTVHCTLGNKHVMIIFDLIYTSTCYVSLICLQQKCTKCVGLNKFNLSTLRRNQSQIKDIYRVYIKIRVCNVKNSSYISMYLNYYSILLIIKQRSKLKSIDQTETC